jgi:hypothetical protein
MNDTSLPDRDTLVAQYQVVADLYKFYFAFALKLLIFHYAVTGAILSFYFSQPNIGLMRFALMFPALMSIAFAVLAFYGSCCVTSLRNEIISVAGTLKLKATPDVRFLKLLLIIAGTLLTMIAIALTVIPIWR